MTAQFLAGIDFLTWRDVLWGYERKLFGWRTPLAIAAARVAAKPAVDLRELDLANLSKEEDWKVRQLLSELAGAEPQSVDPVEKWLYLELLWLYRHRTETPDYWERIGKIYADYDYPDAIRALIPWLPAEDGYDPKARTREENRERMVQQWEHYLAKTTVRFSGFGKSG